MRQVLPIAAALILTGCGYVAGPLPPLANVPAPVQDLGAVQRGSKLVIQFSIPEKTTEGMLLHLPPAVDVRVGVTPQPFDAEQWAAQAKAIPPGPVKTGRARYEVDAGEWTGKVVAIGVRIVGLNGKDAGWSNHAFVAVIAPLDRPKDLHADTADGTVRLTWQATGQHFRVLRSTGTADVFENLADVTQPAYTDSKVEYGTRYTYLVMTFVPQEMNREAQSDLSEPLTVTAEAPAPSAPKGVRAVPSTNSIELAWETNPEPDVTAYRIYRATAGGPMEKLGDVNAIPTYSDRTAEHGKTYRYTVTAIGANGKESPQAAPVEVALP